MGESRFKEVRAVRRELQELVVIRLFRRSGRRQDGEDRPGDGPSWNKRD